ncbi:12336_t:CDS:2, partial [Funneliformis geosporum]
EDTEAESSPTTQAYRKGLPSSIEMFNEEYMKELIGYTKKQLALIYRKGVYFYNYINSHDRFQETELPSIYEFYSTLKGEYHDLYLKTDVFSLADVWTEF